MSSETTGGSILLVEDHLELQENVRLLLEGAGYRVSTANDGVDALAVLRTEPVSLILSDIEMPRLNGYQLYRQICKNSDWVTIPFLFLSGRDFDSDIRYGKELGADGYLTKPIKPNELLSAIEDRLSQVEPPAEVAREEQALAARSGESAALDCSHTRSTG